MTANQLKRRILFKGQGPHDFSSAKQYRTGLYITFFNNGDIELMHQNPFILPLKKRIKISNEDIAQVQAYVSPGRFSQITVTIIETSGNKNSIRVRRNVKKKYQGRPSAKLPSILASLYGDRFSTIS